MKKGLVFIITLTLCLLISGCGNTTNNVEENPKDPTSSITEDQTSIDVVDEPNGTDENNGLVYPKIESWELYKQNGFDSVAILVSNPNDIAIGATFDVVYYKDGKEVTRNEMFSFEHVLPNAKTLVFGNFDIPNSDDVDDIKLENVLVAESQYTTISGEIELDGIGTECELYFLPLFEQEPSQLDTMFLFYNDDNGNDKYDKGEISFVSSGDYTEDRWLCVVPIKEYTDFEIFYSAY